MSKDLRRRHDAEIKKRAIELREHGYGHGTVAGLLGVPRDTVRQWFRIAGAVGIEVLMDEGRKHTHYSYETKLAAARAVVDKGMTKAEAMAAFGIASLSPLEKWCKAYREGGAKALEPKAAGRPKGSKAMTKPPTREEELEVRLRKLEAENAYLKKLAALRAEETLRTGSRPRW